MVEDEAGDAVLVEHALKQGSLDFCLRRVETREAFLQELNRFNPSVILSDHGLPSFDGFAALSLARKKAPEVPFIFVTGSLGEEMTIKALKSGAADFILKHRLEGLPSAVQRALRQIELRQERRKAEEALHSSEERYRRLSVELEKRVAVRTRELEAANEELEAFSYSVSHDLRAPLRHIRGYVEILMATKVQDLDEESRKHLGSIADSAQQMGRLLDGLLTFSRAARAELRKTRFQLSDLVKACIRDFEHETGKRKVEWVVGELPEVCADPALLRQVMVNLLNNALKYTRPREVARIEVGCCSDSEAHVLFVRDNGVGFDPRYAEKLFGVFQRLHLAAEFEGTGVGLANVRRIISRHGGRTWAEGQTDKGATFYFTMPKAARD